MVGTEPTRRDDTFQRIAINRTTGQRATSETPTTHVEERLYRILPAEYHEWMRQQGMALVPTTTAIEEIGRSDSRRLGSTDTIPQSPNLLLSNHVALILSAPTAHTAYTIHPGVPRDRQRIEVAGYTVEGQAWAELQVLRNSEVLASAANATRLQGWWVLEAGEHTFQLRGKLSLDDSWIVSDNALVVVEPFNKVQTQAIYQQ